MINTIQQVGFIGLGDQHSPMARAIAERHVLHVWASRPEAYEVLAGVRYFPAASVEELADSVDVLCLCLPSDADLFKLIEDHNLVARLGGGKILINHATGHPSNAERLEEICDEFAVGFLDAPVSGGRPGAETRSLTTFVGGRRGTYVRCENIIRSHSADIIIMGPAGTGQFAKLCNNALTISNLRNLVEVFEMATEVGIRPGILKKALEHSSGSSFILQALGTKITPESSEHIAELIRKDIREFGCAMAAWGVDAGALLDWAMKGPDRLPELIDSLGEQDDNPPMHDVGPIRSAPHRETGRSHASS